MALFNLNNLSVDANGRVSLSGLSSGIDFNQVVDDIIAAKRIPVDSIETRITESTDKIAALEDLRGLVTALRVSLDSVRGKVSLGNTGNVFSSKQVFASTSRTDGVVPSAAANLLGASVSNSAAVGSHTIEVLRAAAAHKVASSTFASKTTALALSGTFEVTGSKGSATITVAATDTLQDVRDRVNSANTGVNATGVTASIVQTATNQFILVFTADDTGQSMTISDTGTVLSGLGVSTTNGNGGFRNGLIDANSKIDATSDGFKHVLFDGTQGDKAFLISYSQATNDLTMTRGDGTSQTVTLSSTAIAAGNTETATFSDFGATIVLDENFDKSADILVDADTASVTGGTGAIDAGTIKISGSAGDISGIASTTLTFGNLAAPAAISVTVGAFSGTFDGTATGAKTVNLSDGGGNTLTVQFTTTGIFDGTETAASINLQELENLVVSNGTQFSNQLQAPQTARFTADGLLDADRFESRFLASSTATLSSLAPGASDTNFNINVGGDTVQVSHTGTDTLAQLVTAINTAITTAGGGNAVFDAGTSASLMTDGAGVRLVITNTSGAAITLTDTSNLMAGLGVDNNLVIERTSNTVSDLFDGMTLTLFQAEEGTQIKLDVDRDLGAAKVAIQDFVTAYNELKQITNLHSQIDTTTGKPTEDTGILFGSPTLLGVGSRIASVFAQQTQGVDTAFAALAQVGVKFVDNKAIVDPLLANTLEIDDSALDEALLNSPDDVRRLFAFDFSSSDPRVSLLGYTGKTSYNAAGYTLNLNFDDRFHSQAVTEGGSFTQVDAQTGGPAADGISAIAFADEVLSGNAYRYSYDNATEQLTLTNLTTGLSEAVGITALLDAVVSPPGSDLAAGQTVDVAFASHDATITLSGDNGFARATGISDGALDTTDLAANGLTMTGGAVTTPTTGMNKATVDALIAAGAYDAASGLLTLNVDSIGVGDATFDAAAGIKFAVDGGAVGAGPTANVGDGAPHTVDIYVNDGVADVKVGSIAFTSLASAGVGTGDLTVDLGTGLLGETSTVASSTAPMENYLTFADGTFQIRDPSNNLLGTVAYNKTDSLTTLASSISGSVTDVTATVIDSGGTFKLEVVHSNRDVLTFAADTGGLIAQLNITNGGDGVFSANINGASNGQNDGSATVSGRSVTATSLTGAEGLKIFYGGSGDLSAVTLDYTVGFGARLFSTVDQMLTAGTGLIDANIETLKQQNTQNQKRVDSMVARLELSRANLLARFITMEAALAQAKNLQENLQQTFDSMFNNQSR